ncbi:sigma-54 interaction domain-containing protein [Geomonas subterranea]|uniref:sigma-54 interaction domain-containing protein n=1 Tax=Geomonas subterranea TaxID=2847989 RepID=UPI001CD669FB|nr:sigma 54-interacting transcriptional regulator [Geomonas fuzhouensis]
MGIDKDKSRLNAIYKPRPTAQHRISAVPVPSPPLTKEEMQRLVQQLEIHQIELETQNEELRQAREELEVSLNNYSELYDFAPLGYFTFDINGVIRQVNLTGAQLLGVARHLLVDTPFTRYLADAQGRELFPRHLASVAQNSTPQQCQIRLKGKDDSIVFTQFRSVRVDGSSKKDGHVRIFCSVVDDTIARRLKEDLQKSHDSLESTVSSRTGELAGANKLLAREIEERKKTEESLQEAYSVIERLKDRLQAENIYLQQEAARQYNFGEIIGQSEALAQVMARVEQVAPMNATVLLQGETGTGKGMVARAIHNGSVRRKRPMITVNCTALPVTLVESELFGREKGAFTGAFARQIGRFELADGGTIFLDEIGDMPLELQSKLLRVIQDGEFERLGGNQTIKTDVRIIAATNRNLEQEIRTGRFREDLYYRLNVFPILMPPLRQRSEDIPLLVDFFLAKFNKKNGREITTVPKETMRALQQYQWPGNVRELESVIERAVITSQGSTLQVLDRFDSFRSKEDAADKSWQEAGEERKWPEDIKALVDLERDHILSVLLKTGWRIEGGSGAAVILGINASTLRARMRKLGIVRK